MEENYLVTGGYDSSVQYAARKNVSQYSTTGFQHELPPLNTGRYGHACGKFYDDDGSQVGGNYNLEIEICPFLKCFCHKQ